MAKQARKKSARGRRQDRALVAGGQQYEVGYEAKKKRTSAGAVKKAVKKVGNSGKRVERALKKRQPWVNGQKGAPSGRSFVLPGSVQHRPLAD